MVDILRKSFHQFSRPEAEISEVSHSCDYVVGSGPGCGGVSAGKGVGMARKAKWRRLAASLA